MAENRTSSSSSRTVDKGPNVDSTSRLTSLLPSTGRGGLVSKKKKDNGDNGGEEKPVSSSRLGLDKLAASKRQQQRDQQDRDDRKFDREGNDVDRDKRLKLQREQQHSRNYRRVYDETPSHPGGVNREVQMRARERHNRRYGSSQQISHSSSQSDRRSGDGYHRRDYDDDDRDDDRRRRHGRRQEDYDDSDRSSSRKRRRSGYEDDDDRGRSYDGGYRSRRGDERAHNDDSSSRSDRDRDRRRGRDYHEEESRRRRQDSPPPHSSTVDRRDHRRDSRGESYRRRPQHEQERQNYGDRTMPPPPRSQQNHQRVTPSTQSSSINGRESGRPSSSSRRGRPHSEMSSLDSSHRTAMAPTPRRETDASTSRHGTDRSSAPSSKRSNAWDVETPAPMHRDTTDDFLLPRDGKIRPTNLAEEDDNNSFDRDFYLQEDEGHYVVDQQQYGGDQQQQDLGRFLYTSAKIEAREKEMDQRRQNGLAGRKFNARQSALQDDQDAWENNRLLSSGAALQGPISLDNVRTEQDTRVTLLVHQVKPPFLDGRVSFSTIRDAVPTVKDNSSDFSKMARQGSETLRVVRAKKEKNTMRQKFWELGGTRMGQAVGVQGDTKETTNEGEGSNEKDGGGGEIDYKKSTGFAQHVKTNEPGKKDGAVSEFAKTKSIRQQRYVEASVVLKTRFLALSRTFSMTSFYFRLVGSSCQCLLFGKNC